jgi:cobalamin biosynthesis Co2+ chelatase CbiK
LGDLGKPVVVVAFNGTADAAGRDDLAEFDVKVRRRFLENEVRWALTSPWMIRNLTKLAISEIFPAPPGRNPEKVQGIADLYAELAADGKKNVVVMLLMVHECGASMDIYEMPKHGLNINYVTPVMSHENNVDTLVRAMVPQFGGRGTVNIMVGHGNLKRFDLNDSFEFMSGYVKKNYDNVFVATLHGPPGTETAFAEAKKVGASETVFLPLMIVSGGHITDDVMADKPDSWKNLIGLPARVGESFSKNDSVMEIYLSGIAGQLARFTD